MNKLSARFIVYNLLIITFIAVLVALLIYVFGKPAEMTFLRLLGIIALMLGPVWIGSFLSSRISMKPVRESWQRQLDFTADASHELRTPLAVIRSNLELVMDNPDETVESQKKWLDNIHVETIRMTGLVDDLLTLSRADTGAKTLEYSHFSLNAAALETAALFETMANQKGIVIDVIADDEVRFWGDHSRIKQLLAILVDNSIKYMGKPGKIFITLSKKDKIIQLTVADTGNGISPVHLAKVFNRFYRVDNDKQSVKGFGLGLSIAQWIVNEHGGSIKAESAEGKGAQFTICFNSRNKLTT